MRIAVAVLVTLAISGAGSVPAQVVTSARLTRIPPKDLGIAITLQNLREVTLREWAVELLAAPDGKALATYGGSREVPAGGTETATTSVGAAASFGRVVLAVFADGTAEGTARQLQEWQARRGARMEELEQWMPVLERAPRGSDEELAAYLKSAVAARLERHPTENIATASAPATGMLTSRVRSTYLAVGISPRLYFAQVLRGARADREALARPIRIARTLGEADVIGGVPVTVQGSRSPFARFQLESLTDKRIDAYSVRVGNCGASTDRAGRSAHGRSGALDLEQDRRFHEVSLGCATAHEAPPKIDFVMFEDGTFEGSSDMHRQVLEQRQHDADDLRHLIAILRRALEQSPDGLVAYLERERAAFAKHVESEGRMFRASWSNEYIRRAQRDATGFLAEIPRLVEYHEAERRALLRHVER
jgi:hypothetical protein